MRRTNPHYTLRHLPGLIRIWTDLLVLHHQETLDAEQQERCWQVICGLKMDIDALMQQITAPETEAPHA